MPKLVRSAAWILAAVAAALGAILLLSWRSPPFYVVDESTPLPAPILSESEYEAVHATFSRPYVVECAGARGHVVLYGAAHTRDPNDPQIADLEARFRALAPSVLLVEGRPGAPLAALGDAVAKFGESGAVIELARRARIAIYTWEPTREAEMALQLARFPQERVALFYVLRPYVSSFRFGKPADPDAVVEATRRERVAWPGLAGSLPDVAAIDALWRRDFAGLPDWRDTSDEYGWPGYLAELAQAANAIRDEHFARVILDLMARGERVFAVAGSSHAVRLERPLRAACGAPARARAELP